MNLQDPATLSAFMQLVETEWSTDARGAPLAGWIEQTDDEGGLRVLLGLVKDLSFEGKRLRVFRVKMSCHRTGPIHYVFSLKGSGDTTGRLAHYILSHERSICWRQWFCETTRRSVPHLGTYRGDLSLVGPTFRAVCEPQGRQSGAATLGAASRHAKEKGMRYQPAPEA